MSTLLTPSGEELIILLNATFIPPTIFADTNITFGTPTPAPEGATDYDTVVFGTGIPGRGYYGSAEIHYTRCPLSNLAGLVALYSTAPFTLAIIVDQLNSQFDTFLDVSDFVPPTIPTLTAGQMATVTLTAASSSLGWEGSVDIVINYGKPFLPSVIGSNKLFVLTDGLNAANGQVSGPVIMADLDFTSFRDALAIVTQNPGTSFAFAGFADPNAIYNVCLAIGLPPIPLPQYGWTGVADYATSAVAGSNTNFDRVVVMTSNVRSRYYPGPLYFHYNLLDNR
jgi:hypothetical protein